MYVALAYTGEEAVNSGLRHVNLYHSRVGSVGAVALSQS